MTDQAFLQQVQRRMLEPAVGGTLFRSGTWTVEEVLGYTRHRQQTFLGLTHAQAALAQIAVAAGTATVDLPDDWIVTILPIWRDGDLLYRSLPLGDRFEADHALGTSQLTAGRPRLFVDGHGDSLEGRLIPAPDEDGTLFLYYVPLGTVPSVDGEELSLTDDQVRCALQWGVIADLLGKVGRAHDPVRAVSAAQKFALAGVATEILLKGWG